MDKQQYDTIKLQINQEKEQILKEVYELTAEKRKIEQIFLILNIHHFSASFQHV
ncbi:cytoplasmic protein [Bacillus cereus]|nr:cytoplasmic protein [Bacillus cereus]